MLRFTRHTERQANHSKQLQLQYPLHLYYCMNYIPSFLYYLFIVKTKGVPRQAEVAQGIPDRLRPRIFLTFRHYKGGRSSAKRTGRLYPRRNPSEADRAHGSVRVTTEKSPE